VTGSRIEDCAGKRKQTFAMLNVLPLGLTQEQIFDPFQILQLSLFSCVYKLRDIKGKLY
jgi:hypothetical protein